MRSRLPVPAFLAWTLFVWASRIRLILADDGLSTAGTLWRVSVAGLFVVLALVVLVARRRRAGRARTLLGALVVGTVAWWSVRGIGILLDGNHAVGFKVVHTILMIVSIGLAMWAWAGRDG